MTCLPKARFVPWSKAGILRQGLGLPMATGEEVAIVARNGDLDFLKSFLYSKFS